MKRGGQTHILTAADALPEATAESTGSGDKAALEYIISSPQSTASQTLMMVPPVLPTGSSESTEKTKTSGSASLLFVDESGQLPTIDYNNFRIPSEPEECCLCRSVKADDDASTVIQSISLNQLKLDGTDWTVNMDGEDLSPWHGAPVISLQDGKIIGLFVAGKKGAMIVPHRDAH